MNTSNIPAISIAVFENTKRSSDRAPTRNIVVTVNQDITLKDGTFLPSGLKLEGGLWNATSKSGISYERGSLGDPYERSENKGRTYVRGNSKVKAQPRQVSELKEDSMDF